MSDNAQLILIVIVVLILGAGGATVIAYNTRGIKNKNPGNIVFIEHNPFNGQIGSDGTFGIYDTMVNGIRAMRQNLHNYQDKHGLHTVDSIIRAWSTTDQDAYVANVSSDMAVAPNDMMNVHDYGTLFALVRAIIKQEQGTLPALTISDATVNEGLQSA